MDARSVTLNAPRFDLSFLNDFFAEILSSTDRVRRILENECNEARNVLRACPIEIISTKEIDETSCTCNNTGSLENHAKEIVEGIGKALAQAQELREKIATNISKQNRRTREPDVETIYMPNKRFIAKKLNTSEERKKSTKSSKPEISNKAVSRSTKNPNAGASKEKTSVDVQKCQVVSGKRAEMRSKTVTEKKRLQLSAGNVIGSNADKNKKTRNFVAANKSNVKNFKRNSKSTVDLNYGTSANFTRSKQFSELSPLSGTSQTLSGCATSIAELNDLMTKVSVEESKRSSASCLDAKDPDCPCHGADARKIIKQRVRSTIDMMEGLDRFGIPGCLVRLLKIYHSYTSKELSREEIVDARCQQASNRFLMEFHNMNENRVPKRKTTYSTLEDLTIGFASLFRELYDQSSDVTNSHLSDAIIRYSDLDYRSKTRQLRKFDPAKIRKMKTSVITKTEQTGARGWSANGVWNRAGPGSFPVTTRIHCIRYANKGQLLSFFELNQRLQLLLYRRNLMDLLIDKVLPNIRENFHHSSAEYSEGYKMIFTIAQVLNPRDPVLVRTDV